MPTKKIRVAILFGGKSAEHEVSIQSAKNVYQSLDKKKYDITLIGIDKTGTWHRCPESLLLASSFEQSAKLTSSDEVSLVPQGEKSGLVSQEEQTQETIDVVFPVLHGPYGEDGSMQGFLKIANLPFVGSGVLGSAIGMDKDVTKRLLRDAGLPIGKFLVLRTSDVIPNSFRDLSVSDKKILTQVQHGKDGDFETIVNQLGLPFFVKPANLGSSIGVSKVTNEKEFTDALQEAFSYDTKVLIEEYIPGKEVECSVLGNDEPIASIPGEIVANKDFYSYEAKYLDENGATLKIPADLPEEKVKEVQSLAIQVFRTLCLEGMARVDFFYTPEGKFYVNEANTLPGFTNISMYPELWEASGMKYSELVDRLIQLALDRHKRQSKLKTSL
jgi:D-alanine-D-alanine ligase